MRTTVDLDPNLLRRMHDEAHRRGVPFKNLLRDVVLRGLEERPTLPGNPYRCPEYSMGEPLMPLEKALSIAPGAD